LDASGTNYILEMQMFGGHRVSRDPVDVMEDAGVRIGAFPGQFNTPPTFFNDASPPFAGISVFAFGNAYAKHPSFDQPNASPVEKQWYMDVWPFQFNGSSDSVVPVSGSLYKDIVSGQTIDTTKLPYFAVSGSRLLRDVSGPNSSITGSPAENNTYCVVKNAGECVLGSSPGQVYFNVAILTMFGCFGGENGSMVGDFCVQHTAAYGQSLTQFGLTAGNLIGTKGGIPDYGAAKSRNLVRGLIGGYKNTAFFDNAHPLPDGSWALFPSRVSDLVVDQTYLVKVPPYPAVDAIDRTNFENVPAPVTRAGTAVSVRISYGYEENGPRTNFYCTQRPEVCTLTGTINSTIMIPAIPQRVLFYRADYLDASNAVVGSDAVVAVPVP